MGIHKGFLFYGHLKPLFLNSISISTDVYTYVTIIVRWRHLEVFKFESLSIPFSRRYCWVLILQGGPSFQLLFIFQSSHRYCSFSNRLVQKNGNAEIRTLSHSRDYTGALSHVVLLTTHNLCNWLYLCQAEVCSRDAERQKKLGRVTEMDIKKINN